MKKLLGCLIAICLTASLWACGGDEAKEGSYIIYYTNKDTTELVEAYYEPEATDTDSLIAELIGELSKNGEDANMVRAIPEGVEVTGAEIKSKALYLTFNSAYYDMAGWTEVLCRAAVVRTLTQVDGVESVTFYVGEDELLLSSGETAGNMTSSDFVDNMANSQNDEEMTTFTLYFANETGDGMLAYTYEDTYSTDSSMERYIVEQLIKGPTEEGYYRTLSDQVELISVSTDNGICYVNFGGNFLTETTNVQDHIVIYSIVDSILEVSHVSSVQLSVNGETDVLYHANISLESPFTRNMDYVVEVETEEESE